MYSEKVVVTCSSQLVWLAYNIYIYICMYMYSYAYIAQYVCVTIP